MTPTFKLEPPLRDAPHGGLGTGSFAQALFLIARGNALLSVGISKRNGRPLFNFAASAAADMRLFEVERIHLAAETERAVAAHHSAARRDAPRDVPTVPPPTSIRAHLARPSQESPRHESAS
jgi:hypothetical protein